MERNLPLPTKEGRAFKNRKPFGIITADKARQLAQEDGFPPSGRDLFRNFTNNFHENDHRELFKFVTESPVENIVKALPSNKAPGVDNNHAFV